MKTEFLDEVPFTQYIRPDGHQKQTGITMPKELADKAFALIKKGYFFECEVLMDGTVSLICEGPNSDEDGPIAIELCPNGPEVPTAVKNLIIEAESLVTSKSEEV